MFLRSRMAMKEVEIEGSNESTHDGCRLGLPMQRM